MFLFYQGVFLPIVSGKIRGGSLKIHLEKGTWPDRRVTRTLLLLVSQQIIFFNT